MTTSDHKTREKLLIAYCQGRVCVCTRVRVCVQLGTVKLADWHHMDASLIAGRFRRNTRHRPRLMHFDHWRQPIKFTVPSCMGIPAFICVPVWVQCVYIRLPLFIASLLYLSCAWRETENKNLMVSNFWVDVRPLWSTDGPWTWSFQVWWSSFNWNISSTPRIWLKYVSFSLSKHMRTNGTESVYRLVQCNWFSDVTGSCNSGACRDFKEPISLHRSVCVTWAPTNDPPHPTSTLHREEGKSTP